ncbi:MAG: hypothetical protein U5K99_07535 [Anaerolineales bacterium]|nr:hypothetical protein [Anaerolineales bacterium]
MVRSVGKGVTVPFVVIGEEVIVVNLDEGVPNDGLFLEVVALRGEGVRILCVVFVESGLWGEGFSPVAAQDASRNDTRNSVILVFMDFLKWFNPGFHV